MATRLHYFGDVEIASRYKATAESLLESLRRSQPIPSSLNRLFPDGTRIVVTRATPEIDMIDIWAGQVTSEDRWVWTLLYAPCPPPDRQDWAGWIEASKTTLDATNFLNTFALLGWANAFYGDFDTADPLDWIPSSITSSLSGLGWVISGVSGYWTGGYLESPYYQGCTQNAYALERLNIARNTRSLTYTFPSDLFTARTLINYTESGVKHWRSAGFPTVTDGYVMIPLNPNPLNTMGTPPYVAGVGVVSPYDPGYSLSHDEGLLSWESLYLIGFWKWEWIIYTPSTYLDEDNYCGFYDYYISDTSESDTYLTPMTGFVWNTMEANFAQSYYGFTDEMEAEYIQVGANHLSGSYTLTGPNTFSVEDPDSDGFGNSRGSINYTTHFAGKYEGVYFDETIGQANEASDAGQLVGTWSGENVFPWMARIYDKNQLLEGDVGQETPSEHHLMIASWLSGAATDLPGMGASWMTPGCAGGITKTTYRLKHGSIEVTKEYDASHPGWHDVYTEDGRTWRAYGDLFAALKKVRG